MISFGVGSRSTGGHLPRGRCFFYAFFFPAGRFPALIRSSTAVRAALGRWLQLCVKS